MRRRLLNVVVIAFFLQSTYACSARPPKKIQKLKGIKYILIWRAPDNCFITNCLGIAHSAFKQNNCSYSNCYVARDMRVLQSVKDFDAVVFNGRFLDSILPEQRSVDQKYIYGNVESSSYHPICNDRYNNFFNLTWSYRLNSDLVLAHFRIFDSSGKEVGPRIDMHWSQPGTFNNETETKLQSKTLAAAWFVSNCNSKSRREDFVFNLQRELIKFGYSVDIYGRCGRKCPKSESERCFEMIKKHYFFYLSFENSFDEDYVTEKVLTAILNYAVPVVFGGANYSRFLPPGSYLDARELGPRCLATRMASIIDKYKRGQRKPYHSFFRWRSSYTIKQTNCSEHLCEMCKQLNDEGTMSKRKVYGNVSTWWNWHYSRCTGFMKPIYRFIAFIRTQLETAYSGINSFFERLT